MGLRSLAWEPVIVACVRNMMSTKCKCGHGKGNHLGYLSPVGKWWPDVCKSCWNYCYSFRLDNLKYLERLSVSISDNAKE